ncbi:AAA family ATPase [Kitasatospora sp. NPDC057500]|uniref:AAA family ATPase n=1 Tax=Kitasatospora sp. NPDC057500 TaxID=3346151 RepID=UPI0036BC21CA
MQLIERGSVLAELNRLLSSSRRGTGHAVVLSGPISSGKTGLLNALAEQLAGSDVLFLSAVGSRMEQEIPLGVVTQLFEAVSLPIELRDEVRGILQGASGGRLCSQMLQQLTSVLGRLAAERTVLIGVDDIHHADGASLQFFLWLSRRLRTIPTLLLLTDQEQGGSGYMEFRAELLRGNLSTRLSLAPLSPAGVADLLDSGLETDVGRRLGQACYEFSGGNPLLARALIEDNRGVGGESDGPIAGDAYGRAILDCVRRCALDHALDVARGLAVLGEHATPALLTSLLAVNCFTVAQVMETFSRAGILAGGHFRHPQARLALLNDMTPAEHASLHLRAASTSYDCGLPLIPVAQFLLAANDHGEPWADEVLCKAAETALGQGKVSFAIQCLQLAGGTATDSESHRETVANLAAAEWRVSPTKAARRYDQLIVAAQDDQLSGPRTEELIRSLLWDGRLDEGASMAERLLRRSGEPSPGFLVWLQVSYPDLLECLPAESLPVEPQSVQGVSVPAEALLAKSLTAGRFADVAWLAEQFLQSTRMDDRTIDSLESAVLALAYSDHAGQAASWSDRILARAAELNAPTWQARFAAVRSDIALRQGDPEQAEEFADLALACIPLPGWGVVAGVPLASMVRIATAREDHDAATKWLAVPVPAAMFRTRFGLMYQFARGEHYLATGRAEPAFEDFLACGRRLHRWGFAPSVFAPGHASVTTAMGWLGGAVLANSNRQALAEQMARVRPEAPVAFEETKEPAEILTSAEYRVAELASAGHTNREISRKLYIATSTVEQHLTRAYRKLKVQNRQQLSRTLTQQTS